MSFPWYLWIKAIHQLGFLLWVGSMFTLTLVLAAHARAAGPAQSAFIPAERAIGRAMELGALLTIACGVVMILKTPYAVSPIKEPYIHIKLTLVAAIIVLHGLVRAKMARLGRGQGSAPGTWMSAAILLLAVGAIWLAVVKPALHM